MAFGMLQACQGIRGRREWALYHFILFNQASKQQPNNGCGWRCAANDPVVLAAVTVLFLNRLSSSFLQFFGVCYQQSTMLEGAQRQQGRRCDDQTLAMILVVIGSCSYSGGYIYCNEHKFHPVETSVIRGVAVTIICFCMARYLKLDLSFKSAHNYKWLLARNAIMVLHNFGYTFSQFYLPLPVAITLNSISPIFVYIYDYYLYGVTINRTQIVFLVVAIVGVAVTSNGSYLISYIDEDYNINQSKFQGYQSQDPMVMTIAGVGMILLMMVHGYGVMLTKKFQGVHTVQVNFIQGILILFSGVILYPLSEGETGYSKMDMEHFFKGVFLSGIPMTIGQLSYIGALILTKNMGVITTLSFTSIIMGFLISVFRYGEQVNVVSTLGTIAIVIGITFIVKERDKANKR